MPPRVQARPESGGSAWHFQCIGSQTAHGLTDNGSLGSGHGLLEQLQDFRANLLLVGFPEANVIGTNDAAAIYKYQPWKSQDLHDGVLQELPGLRVGPETHRKRQPEIF